jgi:hypothetical protein
LIFPYRQNSDPDEPGNAKCPKPPGSFGTMEAERTTQSEWGNLSEITLARVLVNS